MREIKFRVWNKEEKKWRLPDDEQNNGIDQYEYLLNLKGELQDNHSEDCIIMQFTGLKDVKGKEIYFGDIVEWDDSSKGKWRRRCAVDWKPAHIVLKGYYYDTQKPETHTPIDFDFGAFIYEKDGELEVIGNIYEHSHLLNPQP